jgi:membrane protein DedA with SNARE-associated domain
MTNFFTSIGLLFAGLGVYKYAFLFITAFFEGPVIMTATGFLLHFGQFNFFVAFLALVFGDLAGDFAWYAIGYFAGKKIIMKYGKYISLDEKIVDRIERLYKNHQGKIIILSKITMGFGFSLATLTSAGMSRMPLKKFGLYNFIGGLIWVGFLMFLGYSLGSAYIRINEGLRVLFIIGSVAALLAALYGFQRYIRNKFSHQ